MQGDLREPFDSVPRLLARSASVYFGRLPLLAGLALAVFIPGKLLLHAVAAAAGIPPDGIVSYLLMDLSDLALGALAAPAAIHALTTNATFAVCLRRGRRVWGKMLWNKFKVEITVALWSLLLFVPGLIAMTRLALVEPVVVLEEDEQQPLARSRELTEGRRWRVFFVLVPLMILDLGGSIGVLSALPGVAHSRWMLALSDSLLAVVGMWTTVATLLMYLGLPGAGAGPKADAGSPGKSVNRPYRQPR